MNRWTRLPVLGVLWTTALWTTQSAAASPGSHHAEPPDPEPPTTSAEPGPAQQATDDTPFAFPSWLLGVGVGVTLGSVGIGTAMLGTGTLGAGSAGLASWPLALYSAGAERRLGESLWLTATLAGGFETHETEGSWPDDGQSYSLGGRLGLRPVINPGDRVQLSLPTSVGGSYGRSRLDTHVMDDEGAVHAASYRSRSWALDVQAGLAVDFWVAEFLALRLATSLLTMGHQQTDADGVASRAWFANLGLAPSFAVEVGL